MQSPEKTDRKKFFKLVRYSTGLNLAWGFISSLITFLSNKYYDDRTIAITIIFTGFLFAHSIPFFVMMEKPKKTAYNFIMLSGSLLVLFFVACLVEPMLLHVIGLDNASWIASIAFLPFSSLIASVRLVLLIGHYFTIVNKKRTIIITALGAFTIASVWLQLLLKFDMEPPLLYLGICIWQIFTSVSVGYSIFRNSTKE